MTDMKQGTENNDKPEWWKANIMTGEKDVRDFAAPGVWDDEIPDGMVWDDKRSPERERAYWIEQYKAATRLNTDLETRISTLETQRDSWWVIAFGVGGFLGTVLGYVI